MADTTEARILKALTDRLQTLTFTPALPVSWSNVDFTPPSDQKYLRVQHVPNIVARQWIASDGVHRYMGLLQVSVHWPLSRGEFEPREIAGAIVAHFPCDLVMVEDGVEVRVTKRPEAADMMTEDQGVQIPCMVEYEAYA